MMKCSRFYHFISLHYNYKMSNYGYHLVTRSNVFRMVHVINSKLLAECKFHVYSYLHIHVN